MKSYTPHKCSIANRVNISIKKNTINTRTLIKCTSSYCRHSINNPIIYHSIGYQDTSNGLYSIIVIRS